ncbi:HAD hydrolase-like protein [Fibrella sp. HMF5335]|uniref:HAD hydrolase-like protein n=1 Tax=Fibrella rubiginis TaxID=2817060 RepID=A0A939GDP0_9BACT|nr:HAD hydrolase-like protein [Fibrella rubiginis]MBO0935863.1 HAD hydrolase-like protein [Fibrella rubiginis]
MTTPYQLLIFDFDGTLADSFPLFVRSFNAVADRYGIKPMNPAELDQLRTLGSRQLMQQLRISAWKVPLVAYSVRRLMTRGLAEVCLFEGVPDLLRRAIKAHKQVAIVSSNSEANVRRVLGPELAALVSQYQCGTALFGKARAFRQVIQRAGVSSSAVLCIGDEVRDYEAARSEGIAFGGVSWGFTQPDTLRALPNAQFFDAMADIGYR